MPLSFIFFPFPFNLASRLLLVTHTHTLLETRHVCLWNKDPPPHGNKLSNFDPAPPRPACDISEVWASLRWTYSSSLVSILTTKTLNIGLYKRDGITDKQTDGWTDRRSDFLDDSGGHFRSGHKNFIHVFVCLHGVMVRIPSHILSQVALGSDSIAQWRGLISH